MTLRVDEIVFDALQVMPVLEIVGAALLFATDHTALLEVSSRVRVLEAGLAQEAPAV